MLTLARPAVVRVVQRVVTPALPVVEAPAGGVLRAAVSSLGCWIPSLWTRYSALWRWPSPS
jgi:hypothetical protein